MEGRLSRLGISFPIQDLQLYPKSTFQKLSFRRLIPKPFELFSLHFILLHLQSIALLTSTSLRVAVSIYLP